MTDACAVVVVLFACVANAGRSQMAAALFNALADPAKARAISGGTHPGASIHPEVVSAMRDMGVDLAHAQPQRLTPELAGSANWLITMGCGDECPVVPGVHREDWLLADPQGRPLEVVRTIRDDIQSRVRELVTKHQWGKL